MLLERAQRGDAQAFADLFDAHRARLARIVAFRIDRRLQGRLDAEDVLQEAYLDAAKRLSHCTATDASEVFIWLRMVVQQTLIDLHRRHLGTQRRDASRDQPWQRPSASDTSSCLSAYLSASLTSPSQAAVRAEFARLLDETLATMSPLDREVLALRHFEELTNNEVAAALEIDPKTASIRYIRALSRLKDRLAKVPGFLEFLGGQG